ncbi:hypothetical protein WJX81_003083 [Elliptochloris bilobata]|uniref:Ku domain-containing protein n=1 Tax=Elliptochloris bilobata TaxID=381761 RepID=A0AAW1SJV5_9CHLO
MHKAIPYAQKSLTNFISSRMLVRQSEEVGLIMYGTTGTKNRLNDSDPDDYAFVTVVEELRCPDLSALITVATMPAGQGHADWVDALMVAADAFISAKAERPMLAKPPVRFVLVSDLASRIGKVENLEDVLSGPQSLTTALNEHKVTLEVVLLDLGPQADDAAHANRLFNLQWLEKLLEGVKHEQRSAHEPADLLHLFRFKDVANIAQYSGPLSLGGLMNIRVKAAKKVHSEQFPSTTSYSEQSNRPDATHSVQRQYEYKLPSNADEEVPVEQLKRGFRYGSQIVPMDEGDRVHLGYFPGEKALELMGFVEAARVPAHRYIEQAWVALADKDFDQSGRALAALVQALDRLGYAAILRFVPRLLKGAGSVHICAGTPLPATDSHPDALLLQPLPFREDIRDEAQFTTFSGQDPRLSDLDAVDLLIDAMDMTSSGYERLRPEDTLDPLLQRFVGHMAALAIDRDTPVPPPSEDPWVSTVLEQRWDAMPAAQGALAAVAERFPVASAPAATKRAVEPAANGEARPGNEAQPMAVDGAIADSLVFDPLAAPASRVEAVGTSAPVEDFEALLQHGQADKAFRELPVVVFTLVDTSIAGRNYDKAMRCVSALRGASVKAEESKKEEVKPEEDDFAGMD